MTIEFMYYVEGMSRPTGKFKSVAKLVKCMLYAVSQWDVCRMISEVYDVCRETVKCMLYAVRQ